MVASKKPAKEDTTQSGRGAKKAKVAEEKPTTKKTNGTAKTNSNVQLENPSSSTSASKKKNNTDIENLNFKDLDVAGGSKKANGLGGKPNSSEENMEVATSSNPAPTKSTARSKSKLQADEQKGTKEKVKKAGPKRAATPQPEVEAKKPKGTKEKVKKAGPKRSATPLSEVEAKKQKGTTEKVKKAGPKRAANPELAVKAKKQKVVEVLPRQTRGQGQVLSVGQGDVGQLGLGPDIMEKSRLALVTLSEPMVDVCAGGMHTVCLSQSGKVYTFGCNDEGALGRSTTEEGSETTAGVVELPGLAAAVSAGDSHTAALLVDGRVFAWGTFRDSSGSIGLTSAGISHTPLYMLPEVPIVKIASGSDHLVMLTDEGDMYSCGNAEQGQLGRVGEIFSNRGGRKGKSYILTPGLVHVKKQRGKGDVLFDGIWAGFYSTFARAKNSNLIFAFGLNNYNQLGIQDQRIQYMPVIATSFTGKNWVQISAGQHHTVALDSEGAVHVLGRREYGRLGLGPNCTDQTVPTQVPDLAEEKGVEVAAGISVSYAVTTTGKVYAWGAGSEGSLGVGDEEDRWSPVLMASKQLGTRQAIACSSGGQHAIILTSEN